MSILLHPLDVRSVVHELVDLLIDSHLHVAVSEEKFVIDCRDDDIAFQLSLDDSVLFQSADQVGNHGLLVITEVKSKHSTVFRDRNMRVLEVSESRIL